MNLDLQPNEVRRVVLVRASRIGDFVCATPAFRALRHAFPRASISLIALPLMRDLVERCPYIDRFLPFPGFPGIAEQFFDARHATSFFAEMQDQQFDLAVQIHGSGVYANPFTLLLGARRSAGFIRPGDPPGLLDLAVPFPQDGREAERVLAIVRGMGLPDCGAATELSLRESDRRQADALLASACPPLIGLHPGTWEAGKRWPVDRFRALGSTLRERLGGTIVVLGGTGEVGGVVLDLGPNALDLVGRTSLPVAAAVISRLSLLVSNDSGPAHMAYALHRPSVTLFAQTDPERWGPGPGPHAVVRAERMDDIPVDRVVAAVEGVLP
jgi:ADP-heptose:LPS heptosyltransferase